MTAIEAGGHPGWTESVTRALNRIRRLEGAKAGDSAAVYLAESDMAAAELRAGTGTKPLVVVTGDSRHSPPVQLCNVQELLDNIALHGRAIYDQRARRPGNASA